MSPFVVSRVQKRNRLLLGVGVLVAIAVSMWLPVQQLVVMKMLPFDNKSEFQVILDMPEGNSLERTQRVLFELSDALNDVEEVNDYQIYAGTAAPINFNGLVRHYFMRQAPEKGTFKLT
ncbi:acriflavin resistance protein [Vibrio variabilis]|uniref:Acriflavin resistance protein n=1 Tax=Vibrio variabilis TaxID=990271 RepID=A0ABQ0JQT2_9VIBR|nr:acriflavin resistance protein [Vibrio variabilis]